MGSVMKCIECGWRNAPRGSDLCTHCERKIEIDILLDEAEIALDDEYDWEPR
jgi:RecJ-like exonuclease